MIDFVVDFVVDFDGTHQLLTTLELNDNESITHHIRLTDEESTYLLHWLAAVCHIKADHFGVNMAVLSQWMQGADERGLVNLRDGLRDVLIKAKMLGGG